MWVLSPKDMSSPPHPRGETLIRPFDLFEATFQSSKEG